MKEEYYTWSGDVAAIILRYFIFAGLSFFIFYVFKSNFFSKIKIQKKLPENKIIYKEITFSIITLIIYCATSWLVFYLYRKGITKIYVDISSFSHFYFIVSVIIMVFIHDAYFYWTHRLLHVQLIFKHIHILHHHSHNPTPWAAFSFHPVEAIISALIIPLIVFTIPVHPYALFIFLTYMTLINVMGHLGYETFPNKFIKSRFGKWQNNSTNHNIHHQQSKVNFGLYFTFWDRWMKTMKEN